jgi:hypothetical protein
MPKKKIPAEGFSIFTTFLLSGETSGKNPATGSCIMALSNTLDDRDRRILYWLDTDARISNSEDRKSVV